MAKREELLGKQKEKAKADLQKAYAAVKKSAKPVVHSPESESIKLPEPRHRPVETPPVEAKPEVIFEGSGGGATEAGWHSIESMLYCPKEYQLRIIRGVRHPLHQNPDHFSVGALFHAGRARWFTLRFAHDAKAWDSIKAAVEEEAEIQKLPVSMRAIQNTLSLLTQYCAYWAKRPRPDPVAAEYKIGPSPFRLGDPFTLNRTARLDDASRYPEAGGALCIGESKTTSGSIDSCFNQYQLHGQPMLQLLLWKLAPQGEKRFGPVKGVMLDITQKPSGKNPARFARMFVPVSDWALTWFANALANYLRAAAQIDWDTEVTRNIAMCTRMAGRARVPCEFRELCSHGRSASIQYVLRDGSSLMSHQPIDGKRRMPWE
jgi:hypothetical protein